MPFLLRFLLPAFLALGTFSAHAQQLGLALTLFTDGQYRIDSRMPADSLSARAGLRTGDVVTGMQLGGQAIAVPDGIAAALKAATPGKPLVVQVQRDGQPLVIRIPLQAAAAAKPAPPATAGDESPHRKMCNERHYSSSALCSDSTCKMREYRKWQTCLKTGEYV